MKKTIYKNNRGFTLIETMVAVVILTLALTSLLNMNANSLFASRYAKNEVTANYLLQEAADYIHNDRDTVAFLRNDPNLSDGWFNFLNKYGYNNGSSPSVCFNSFNSIVGCYFEPADIATIPTTCASSITFGTSRCPLFNYDSTAANNNFYTYKNNIATVQSIFKRQILMSINSSNPDELNVKITVEWLNGNLARKRSLVITLLNWQK